MQLLINCALPLSCNHASLNPMSVQGPNFLTLFYGNKLIVLLYCFTSFNDTF